MTLAQGRQVEALYYDALDLPETERASRSCI